MTVLAADFEMGNVSADHLLRFERLGEKVVEAISRCCQPALLGSLERPEKDGEQIDLTKSGRTWPRIIAAHEQNQKVMGPGISRFVAAVDRQEVCP